MAKRISKKERGFAKDYVENGVGVTAILNNYDTTDYHTAGVMAVENLKKPRIQELIEGFAEKAAKNIQTLANTAENESVRLNANKDQLDRAGYKPIEKSMNVIVDIAPTEKVKKATELLNELLKSGKLN